MERSIWEDSEREKRRNKCYKEVAMSETKEERRNSIAIFRQNESIKPKAYNKTLNVQVSNLLMNNKSFDNIKAMRANQIVS